MSVKKMSISGLSTIGVPGSKVRLTFYPSEIDQMSTRNSCGLSG